MTEGAANSERISGQKRFWDANYREDPDFFGTEESAFARWSLPHMRSHKVRSVVELGFGYGRDIVFFRRNGFEITGVELSAEGYNTASRRLKDDEGIKLLETDALSYLKSSHSGVWDAVYSNLFLNMHFTREEHLDIFTEIARVLRTGGLHLFSVRSNNDPWYGKGKHVATDTFDHSPFGSTLVYFSSDSIGSLTPSSLTTVEQIEMEEGANEFPIRVFYVLQLKKGS